MSEQINDGGPAFPTEVERKRGVTVSRIIQGGISHLDYLAAKAMAALMTQSEGAWNWPDKRIAEWSYDLAEAMLEEKKRRSHER